MKKKKSQEVNVYIYTNNKCIPITWTSIIIRYIENKWNIPNLFDNIILAFKIDNKIVEYNRTTNEKTHHDLIKCLRIPMNTEMCFIDNIDFPKMRHRHVYYLRPKPYYHYVDRFIIIERFIHSNFGVNMMHKLTINFEECNEIFKNWYTENNHSMKKFIKTKQEVDTDILVSKKLLYHCKIFFFYSIKKLKTRKFKKITKNLTKKKRANTI